MLDPWQRAGVTHEEWVAARLHIAALMRAVEQGDPEAVVFALKRLEWKEVPTRRPAPMGDPVTGRRS
jgi:hypothetical protein